MVIAHGQLHRQLCEEPIISCRMRPSSTVGLVICHSCGSTSTRSPSRVRTITDSPGVHLLDSTKGPVHPAVTGVIVEEHHLRPDRNLQNFLSWELKGIPVSGSSSDELVGLGREPCQHRLVAGCGDAIRGC
jgi:hypothetical protein